MPRRARSTSSYPPKSSPSARAQWKARESEYGSGYLWKYSQQVGNALNGAVTHPGGAAEKSCYADT